MPALAHRHDDLPAPAVRARPRLRQVPAPRGGRVPSARALALYAVGLTLGFLLAAGASLPGGAEVVTGQAGLVAAAAVVAGLAGLRARAVARRRARAA